MFLVFITEGIEVGYTPMTSEYDCLFLKSCCRVMTNGSSQQILCYADGIWYCDDGIWCADVIWCCADEIW